MNSDSETGEVSPFTSNARFSSGQIVATPGALNAISTGEITAALHRHLQGNWGDLDPEDIQANKRALETQGRLLSAYKTSQGTKFWIITEADRSATTVLLPSEY
jgi:hypothetical protein